MEYSQGGTGSICRIGFFDPDILPAAEAKPKGTKMEDSFMKKNWFASVLVLCLTAWLGMSLYGCGDKDEDTEASVWRQPMAVATGGTGGVYYPYGGTMADIIAGQVEGMRAAAEVTGASVENVRLVHRHDAEIGLVMGDVAYQAYHGEGDFEGDPQDLQVMFQMYPNVYHVVTLERDNLTSLSDLKGERVSVGAPGSGTEYKTRLVFGSLGLYDELRIERLSFSENTDALRDRNIRAGVWSVGAPTSSIMDLTATHDIRILPFSEEEVKAVIDANPFYSEFIIEAGTYDGQEEDVRSLQVGNTAIVHKDATEEEVYKVVKAIFENRQRLVNVHHLAEWTTPEYTVDTAPVPLHPGTIRYFEEIGMDVPDRLRP